MPLELFYSYSHKDEELRNELEHHLQVLQRSGLIHSWHDRRISPGAEWAAGIDSHIRSAQIILLLISADFLASDYCYGEELRIALEQHDRQRAVVIPVILRPVDWAGAPFARLQALPRDGKAITLWRNRDQAFASVARGIRDVVSAFEQSTPPLPSSIIPPHPPAQQERVLDAALPGHIAVNLPTELLVLIRRPESEGLSGILLADEESEAQPEDVRSQPFEIAFPTGPAGIPEPLKVAIEVTSPDFEPASQRKNVMVPVNGDSTVSSFLLRPLRLGRLMVVVELQWQDAQRGYRRLRTDCLAEVDQPAFAPMHVARMPFVVAARPSQDHLPPSAAPAASEPLCASAPPPLAAPVAKRRKSNASRYGTAAAAALVLCVAGTVGVSVLQTPTRPTAAVIRVPPEVTAPAPPQPVTTPFSKRVFATVQIQARGCESSISPIDLHMTARPEFQQIAKQGNAGIRNIHFDKSTGRLTGELYASGSGTRGPLNVCLNPKPASASYHIVALDR
ncbi:MAG TPA: toll/interleukin-1 receptor domain-containing protein [Bryobacteraceae bacterium]|nr:toll/interleukin-1 receptor domain-containing protein [Bryobacteraceae bacterium]